MYVYSMDIKEAKEKMKSLRDSIKSLKADRMSVSARISDLRYEIINIKGAIFRGEIK